MSTSEQDTPQLTRKQMREQQRETGAVPITPAPGAGPQPVAVPPVPPLPRPADPAAVPPAPVPDASVDLGVSPLTRRQARQQERIRTASVPVITPEVAAAHMAATAGTPAPAMPSAPPAPLTAPPTFDQALTAPAPRPTEPEPLTAASSLRSLFETTGENPTTVANPAPAAQTPAVPPAAQRDEFSDALANLGSGPTPVQGDRPTVGSSFGASLQPGGAEPAAGKGDDSFDGVLSRDTTTNGSVASPHTLIVSQNPTAGPISAPISSTGEILVTGTYALPDGLGSMGHVPGAADGKEVDATLVDGELPVHSSPTPIAASAAISTAKGQDDLIRPPAPEKNSKLMLTLAITAGALALALVGVLVVAFATGVFTS